MSQSETAATDDNHTMTPAEFVQAWNGDKDEDTLVRFTAASLESSGLSAGTCAFLSEAGLPSDAAPFLSFASRDNLTIPSMTTVYGVPEEFKPYRIIGSDGEGSPICIDTSTDHIELLDHEWNFKRILMNSTVALLAETLSEYRTIGRKARELRGPDAWINNDIPVSLIDQFEERLRRVDEPALTEGSFWRQEIVNLRAGPY